MRDQSVVGTGDHHGAGVPLAAPIPGAVTDRRQFGTWRSQPQATAFFMGSKCTSLASAGFCRNLPPCRRERAQGASRRHERTALAVGERAARLGAFTRANMLELT